MTYRHGRFLPKIHHTVIRDVKRQADKIGTGELSVAAFIAYVQYCHA